MNCQISKDLSYHVEKLRSLIQNHKIAMLLLSNSIFYASISLRDPITYERKKIKINKYIFKGLL